MEIGSSEKLTHKLDDQSTARSQMRTDSSPTRHRARYVPKKKRLWAIKELVDEYGGTVWFWRTQIWAGRLPVVRVGRKQFVDALDIEEFIQNHKN